MSLSAALGITLDESLDDSNQAAVKVRTTRRLFQNGTVTYRGGYRIVDDPRATAKRRQKRMEKFQIKAKTDSHSD